MSFVVRLRRSKLAFLLLILFVIDRGWISKIYSLPIVGVPAATYVTSELLYAITFVSTALYRACTSHDSVLDQLYKEKVDGLPCSTVLHTPGAQTSIPSLPTVPIAIERCPSTTQHDTRVNVSIQSTYAVIPQADKERAYHVVNALVTDWHKEIQSYGTESLSASYRTMHDFLQAKQQEWKSYTKESNEQGTTYRTADGRGYCSIGFAPPQDHSFHDYMDQIINEKITINHDPLLYQDVQNIISAFIENGKQLVYSDFATRVTALLNMFECDLGGISYGAELKKVQKTLYDFYFCNDGAICAQALDDMSAARTAMQHYPGLNKSHAHLFDAACKTLIKKRCKNNNKQCNKKYKKEYKAAKKACKQLTKKSEEFSEHVVQKIRSNPGNICCKNMLEAFANCDMKAVDDIGTHHATIPVVATLYKQLKLKHENEVNAYERSLKDKHGIVHFNLPVDKRDPFFTQLTNHERQELSTDPQRLADLNSLLIVRHNYKLLCHQAWNIPVAAPPAVHRVLYTLLDCHTVTQRIDKVHAALSDEALPTHEYNDIIHAFFLPNGIFKDCKQYDRAHSLEIPSTILSPKYTFTRTLLNHLVYLEHTHQDNQHYCRHLAQRIQYIQQSLASPDKEFVNDICLDYEHDEDLDEDESELLPDPELKTCGTGQIRQPEQLFDGECLLRTNSNQNVVISECEPKLNIEYEKWTCGSSGPDIFVDATVHDQQCGYHGQSLPGFQPETGTTDATDTLELPDLTNEDHDSETENDHENESEDTTNAEIVVIPAESAQVISDAEIVAASVEAIEDVGSVVTPVESPEISEDVKTEDATSTSLKVEKREKEIESAPQLIKILEKILRNNKNLTAEQKNALDKVIKELKHRQSLKRCSKDKQITSKGWHRLEELSELQQIISSAEIEWEKLSKVFDDAVVTIKELDGRIEIWIDYEHLSIPIIEINCETGEMRVKGLHHDHLGVLKESGLIKYEVITEPDEHGIYEIKWSYGNAKPKPSTMFPDHWSPAKVDKKIKEALKNAVKTTRINGVRWELDGVTKEGIAIKIIMDVTQSSSGQLTGKIVTAHPVLEKGLL